MANPDVGVARDVRKFENEYSYKSGYQRGLGVRNQTHIAFILSVLLPRELHRRTYWVKDWARLLSGRFVTVVGALLLAASLVAMMFLTRRDDSPTWALYGMALISFIGTWAVVAGWYIRNAPGLPMILTGADIDRYREFLVNCDELHAFVLGPFQRQAAFATLSMESLVLVVFSLPVLADYLTPNMQIVLAPPIALMIAWLELKLVQKTGHAYAILHIRAKEARLRTQTEFPESIAKAAAIRAVFGSLVRRWTAPSVGECILASVWAIVLIAVIAVLCMVRLITAEAGAISATATLVLAVLACVFLLVAVAAESNTALLVPSIEVAHRVLERFHSREAFEQEMRAEMALIDSQIADFCRGLKDGYEDATKSLEAGVPRAPDLDFSYRKDLNNAGPAPAANERLPMQLAVMPAPSKWRST